MVLTFHKKRFPSQDLDKFVIRLPPGLRDRIGAAARANSRSMNAEIISWLEKAFPEGSSAGADFGADPVKADMLIELQHQLGQVTKMIEDLPKRLARTEAGGGNHTVPPRKKKA